MTVLATIITLLSILLMAQSLLALVSGFNFARYARNHANSRQREYHPRAVVLVPCRGLDVEFEENLLPLLNQDYGEYDIIFIIEDESDPAHRVISQMIEKSARPAWLLVAGEARNRGQKIHNLCAGIEMLNTMDRRTEVLVFADADARPGRNWLAELVAPLGDKRIGATTGFRWFVPVAQSGPAAWLTKSVPSTLLMVWNAGALALLGERSRFAWGGSMAIRRENFDRLEVLARWGGAVSDDYVLTQAVLEAGQRIRFIPGALIRSPLSAGWAELIEFTTRQIRITRIYAPTVWRFGLAGYLFYNLVLFSAIALLFTGPETFERGALTIPVIATLLLGTLNGAIRAFVAFRLIDSDTSASGHLIGRRAGQIIAHSILNPLISLLYLYNFIASLASRRIVWRGIAYEMVSPSITIREAARNDPSAQP